MTRRTTPSPLSENAVAYPSSIFTKQACSEPGKNLLTDFDGFDVLYTIVERSGTRAQP
jgi:hypothetical protein